MSAIYVCPECDVVWDPGGDLGTNWPNKWSLERRLCDECAEELKMEKRHKGAVERMVALRDQGMSYPQIAKQLNSEGFLNSKGRPWTNGAVYWQLNTQKKHGSPSPATVTASAITSDIAPAIPDRVIEQLKSKQALYQEIAGLFGRACELIEDLNDQNTVQGLQLQYEHESRGIDKALAIMLEETK